METHAIQPVRAQIVSSADSRFLCCTNCSEADLAPGRIGALLLRHGTSVPSRTFSSRFCAVFRAAVCDDSRPLAAQVLPGERSIPPERHPDVFHGGGDRVLLPFAKEN